MRPDNLPASKKYTIPPIVVLKPTLQACTKVMVRLSFPMQRLCADCLTTLQQHDQSAISPVGEAGTPHS